MKLIQSLSLTLTFFTQTFFVIQSHAYVPKFSTIASKVTKQHGKYPYTLKQNVSFYHGDVPLSIEETWTVLDGTQLLLQARGLGVLKNSVSFAYLYKKNQKYKIDNSKNLLKSSLKYGWFESYFHYKSTQKMKNKMFQHKIIPRKAIFLEPKPQKIEHIKYTEENFLNLARLNENLTYLIKRKSKEDGSQQSQIWIEQDTFHILKIKIFPLVEILAKDYNQYRNQMSFPKERLINWSQHRAQIRLSQVTPISISKARQLLRLQNLHSLSQSKEPTDKLISQFYKNFR